MSKLNYWKPLAALAVVGLLFGAWQADRKAEYRRGRDEMSAEISAKLKDSFIEQAKQSREKEKKVAAVFFARQVELEKEKQDAEKINADLRVELFSRGVCTADDCLGLKPETNRQTLEAQ